jgi:hypothetical protein
LPDEEIDRADFPSPVPGPLHLRLHHGTGTGWEAFIADGRPPALIEPLLRNRAGFPLGPPVEKRKGWNFAALPSKSPHALQPGGTTEYPTLYVYVFMASYGDWVRNVPSLVLSTRGWSISRLASSHGLSL